MRGIVNTNIIVDQLAEKRKTFRTHYQAACHGYRTRRGWQQSYMNVAARSASAIIVRQAHTVTGLAGHEVVLEDLGQNRYEIATDYTYAYTADQTRPFTSRRAAQQRFLEIFFAHARKDEYGESNQAC